jgi:lipoprotein-releasing system permease protein
MPRALLLLLVACGSPRPAPPAAPPVPQAPIAREDREVEKPPPVPGSRAWLKEIVLGVNAHVIVLKATIGFPEYRDALRTVEKHPNVAAAEAFQFVEASITGPGGKRDISVKGVDPARIDRIMALRRYMVKNTTAELAVATTPPPLIIGVDLARMIGVAVGDAVELTLVQGKNADPVTFRVAGLFQVGFDVYDDSLAYAAFDTLEPFLSAGAAIGVEAVVRDLSASEATARDIEKQLGGPPYHVLDWFELNKNLFVTRD